MQPGEALKRLRNNRKISVRAVERASQRIANAKDNTKFKISNGWLTQLENGTSEPGISKLFSLSVIYNVEFVRLLRLYHVDVDETDKFRVIAQPNRNHLLTNDNAESSEVFNPIAHVSTLVRSSDSLPLNGENLPLRGYIGMNDWTMYPLIRPGSLVFIDTKQSELDIRTWRNEYERPIYFVELRDGYACGWCELNQRRLLIIPHPLSPMNIRQFLHPAEAEIIGRVTRLVTDCVDPTPAIKAKAMATR